MNGYIKLFRQFLEWGWYDDINTKTVFLHCLLKANFKPKNWRGYDIKRGQFYTSLAHLSAECGVSVRSVRTSLDKLEKTGEIKRESTQNFTIITICKYDNYQVNEEQDRHTTDTLPTSYRHTTDTLPTTTEERKKDKKDKKENKYKYLAEFQKIKKGDLPLQTQLDKNFHFGLFDDSWSDNFKDAILGMWRYLEGKEYNPISWGNIGTLSSQVSVIKSSLNEFSENEIIKGFEACKFASKKSWHMYINKEDDQSPNTNNYTPPYTLPNLPNDELRLRYFICRFEKYRKEIPGDKSYLNTKLKERAIYKKEAEQVCYQLEQQYPQLTKIQIQWHVTQ